MATEMGRLNSSSISKVDMAGVDGDSGCWDVFPSMPRTVCCWICWRWISWSSSGLICEGRLNVARSYTICTPFIISWGTNVDSVKPFFFCLKFIFPYLLRYVLSDEIIQVSRISSPTLRYEGRLRMRKALDRSWIINGNIGLVLFLDDGCNFTWTVVIVL